MPKKLETEFSLIPFNGDEIMVITTVGKKFVVPKQICENLGLDWSAQRQRINRDSVLSDAMVMITTPQKNPSGSGFIDQETLSLPLEYLNGWLFGIDDTRVKEEIRQKVIDYKKQCYLVLYEFFNKGASIDIERLEGDIELQDYIYRKVRQARTSEKSLWERVKKAFEYGSTDYDKVSDIAQKFYALAQDKIHYAVTKNVASELVHNRINTDAEIKFGMVAFDKERKITLADLQVGKNYLQELELKQYENIGEQLLLKIELRLLRGGKISMEEWFFEINDLLKQNGYEILFDYSKAKITRIEANSKAKEIWKEKRNLLKTDVKNLNQQD
jgi:hypothetical protein